MRKWIALPIVILTTFSVCAQVDMVKYFNPKSYFESLVSGYQRLEFKWTLSGNLQVEMNEGINALEEKSYEIAITHFSNVLKRDSLFGPARYYRGVSYKLSRKFRKAEEDLNLAVKALPKATQPLLELGDLYLVGRDSYRANRFYQKAAKLDPESTEGQFKIGILLLYRNERKKAIKYFETCNKIRPNYPDPYLAIGVVKLLDDQTKAEAFDYFNRSIQVDSLFTMGYFWRGLAHANAKELNRAEKDWSKAIHLNPSNILLFQIRGYLYMDIKKFDEAFSDFKKVLEARSIDEDEAQFGGTPLDRKIGVQNYVSYMMRYGYGLPEETFSQLKKGFCLLLVDKNSEALKAANEALKSDSTACSHYLKGLAFQSLNKHDSAFASFDKAITIDNNIFDVHKNLAIYQSNIKNWKGAMTHLNRMRQIQPRSEVTWRLSGFIKAGLKDYYGAIIDLTHYLKYDTSDEVCLRNRAMLRYMVEDYKGSIDDYRGLSVLTPDDLNIAIQIAENQLLLSDTAMAVSTLRNALAKAPDNIPIKMALANKLIDNHKVEEADKILNEVDKYMARYGMFNYNQPFHDFIQCRIYFAEGKVEKALKEVEKKMTKHGELENFLLLRASILLKLNNLEGAKKDLFKLKLKDYRPAKKLIVKYGV